MLGRFLEVSVQAPDILASIEFYEHLGFTQAAVGEAWPHPYAVMTDGRLAIGLHRYDFRSPSLTFVQPDLLHRIDSLEQLGIELVFRKLGADVFNEAGFTDPDGQMIAMLEARTFSPSPSGLQSSKLGWFEEVALPVRDLEASGAFWESLGFVAAERSDDPYARAGLTSDSLDVGLWRTPDLERPALVFSDPDMPQRIARLRESGLAFSRGLPRKLDPASCALLEAPEGTPLLLLTD
jgi:predicted lactoylglutathione lyase